MNTLIQQLRDAFSDGIKGRENVIVDILSSYVREGNNDWQEYRLFAPAKYARNLVEMNVDFEAIVICWDENQESPIHNHTAQNCWLAVLEGNLEEVYYDYNEETKTMKQGISSSFTCGQVSYISDDIALHKVKSVGGRACTLHIYNRPIPFCNIYDPITGNVTERKAGFFFSERKKNNHRMIRIRIKKFTSKWR